MLRELSVRDLGVIAELSVDFGPGMTALTGETGAGKTLLVEALQLLVGARADPALVRPGAAEALVDGRFELDGDEVILSRAVPVSGRSRAWIDRRMAPLSSLCEVGARLVDLHGQHAYQSLLGQAGQRDMLDSFGRIRTESVEQCKARLRSIDEEMTGLGGDAKARAREIDLLRFQLEELERAGCRDPGEDESLAEEEERLAGAAAHREAALSALDALTGERSSALGLVGEAVSAATAHGPLGPVGERLREVQAELSELSSELRLLAEQLEDDPGRLAEVQGRRLLLRDLRRKYGDSLAEVIAYEEQARRRLEALESYEARASQLESERQAATESLASAEDELGRERVAAASRLSAAVEANLASLAMPKARLGIQVAGTAGQRVTLMLSPGAGEPMMPLSKVASGGELARTMLATRLATAFGPPTLVFDEVDSGIGGEAALAVGRALSAVSTHHQVLVVTHLPQVAAFADQQVCVRKFERRGRAVAEADTLDPAGRVVELSRMLSGHPGSSTARDHAQELLETAARQRYG